LCSRGSTALFRSRFLCACALSTLLLVIPLCAYAESTVVTEETFTDVLTGAREPTDLLLDLLDLNDDGVVGTADLVTFLKNDFYRSPAVGFETSTSTIGEGGETSTAVVIKFSKPFTGTLNFSIDAEPIAGNYFAGDDPPRRASAVKDADYTVAGPNVTLGSPDTGIIPGTITVAGATEAEIVLTSIDDTLIEDMERVIIALEPSGEDGDYIREAPYIHTVFIDENDGRWLCVYTLLPESSDPPGETEPLTPAPMSFEMEFTQLNGTFDDGVVLSDGRGSIPETTGEGIPVDFGGSSATRFEAAFSVETSAEDGRMGFGVTRTFQMVATETGQGHTVRPHQVFAGEITETMIPTDAGSLAGLQTTKPGLFVLSRLPAVPDNMAARDLAITVQGNGNVTRDPEAPYVNGDSVTLIAVPDPGWVFTGWSGDLDGDASPTTIMMDGDKAVTATFVEENGS